MSKIRVSVFSHSKKCKFLQLPVENLLRMNSIVYCLALECYVCYGSESIFWFRLPVTWKLGPFATTLMYVPIKVYNRKFPCFCPIKMCLSSVFLILYVSAVDAIFELFVYWNTHGSCEKDKMQKSKTKSIQCQSIDWRNTQWNMIGLFEDIKWQFLWKYNAVSCSRYWLKACTQIGKKNCWKYCIKHEITN